MLEPPAVCPMPECGAQLYLSWRNGRALYQSDLDSPPALDDLYVSSWTVDCEEGHTVLVPLHSGCECTEHCECDVDHSDDYRTFRSGDAERLRALTGMTVER